MMQMTGPSGGFASYPAMMAPAPQIKHPVSSLYEKLGPDAKIEYTYSETGDTPVTKVYTCTLTLGKAGEAQFIGRKVRLGIGRASHMTFNRTPRWASSQGRRRARRRPRGLSPAPPLGDQYRP
jgi:hypothetical protein